MRSTARTASVCLILLALSACGEPQVFDSPNDSVISSSTSAPEASTTRPDPTTTSTEGSAPTTAQASGARDVCSADLPLDTTPDVPAMELLPPRPTTVLASDPNEYFSWSDVIGTDSYTLRFTGVGAGEDPAPTLIELRFDGPDRHALVSEFGGEMTELITFGDETWSRTGDEDWSTIEEISHMAGEVLAPASAESWYSVAYETFPSTEFVGWAELDGTDVAVFSGGTEAAQIATDVLGVRPVPDGDVTLQWDPAGYFRSVSVTFANEDVSRTNCWMVTDIDETTVRPPGN